MKRIFLTTAACLVSIGASAAEAPVQKPVGPPATGLTYRDCMGIQAGLAQLDQTYPVIVGAGKPTETSIQQHYDLSTAVRDAQTHNLFLLDAIQHEVSAANRRAQLDIGKGEVIKSGTVQNLEFDQRMDEYVSRPCNLELDHIKASDLAKSGPIPGSVRALLWKITDQ